MQLYRFRHISCSHHNSHFLPMINATTDCICSVSPLSLHNPTFLLIETTAKKKNPPKANFSLFRAYPQGNSGYAQSTSSICPANTRFLQISSLKQVKLDLKGSSAACEQGLGLTQYRGLPQKSFKQQLSEQRLSSCEAALTVPQVSTQFHSSTGNLQPFQSESSPRGTHHQCHQLENLFLQLSKHKST